MNLSTANISDHKKNLLFSFIVLDDIDFHFDAYVFFFLIIIASDIEFSILFFIFIFYFL